MLAGAMFYYLFDKSRRFELEKRQQRLTSLVYAGLGFIALALVSRVLINPTNFSIAGAIQAISKIKAAILFSEINPALAGNIYLNIITFGLIIAAIETIWIIIFYEMLLDTTHTTPNLRNLNTWLIIVLIGAVFTILHFTALGIRDNPALGLVFIFVVITLAIATLEGQMLGAILLHVIWNTTSSIYGDARYAEILSANPAIVTLVVIGIATYLLTRQPITSLFSSRA